MKDPCRDCVYKTIGHCSKKKRCADYMPITPSCSNCALKKCVNAYTVPYCPEWEADEDSPFISLLADLADTETESNITLECQDLKPANNWLEHCLDHLNIEPYPRQLLEGSLFFNDICFYCSNPKYSMLYDQDMGNILDNITFLNKGVCPKCGRNRFQQIKSKKARTWVENPGWYEEMVGVAGQRGGKSQMFAMIASYIWQMYMCLEGSPSRYFGLDAGTKLHMTFVALTFGQAKDTLWDPFSHYLRNSWWYKDYHAYIAEKCNEQGIDNVVRFEETFIQYKHKNLQCAPLGPDKRTLRGRTRFMMGIDELGWFSGGKDAVKLNPDEVYKALSNSLKTIRAASRNLRNRIQDPSIPTGYAVNISSPMSARDGIMRLLYKSRKIDTIHAFHIPTWEMNPTLTRDDFADDYAKDPVGANRDFGAFPPLTHSPYISEMSPMLENLTAVKNLYNYTLVMTQNKNSNSTYVSCLLGKVKATNKPMLMAIDAGFSGNAFAITVTSLNHESQVVLEGAIEVKPVDNMTVNFVHVYTEMKKIFKKHNIIAVFIDRWQSIDLAQKIEEDFEIPCIRYSLTYKDFEIIRQKLLGHQVLLPRPENKLEWADIVKAVSDYEDFFLKKPFAHLLLQIATVQDSGRRVEKGSDLDDDIFRALALCIKFSYEEEYKFELLGAYTEDISTANKMIGYGYSTGNQLTTNKSHIKSSSFGCVGSYSGIRK